MWEILKVQMMMNKFLYRLDQDLILISLQRGIFHKAVANDGNLLG
jgi:hypothetical protein